MKVSRNIANQKGIANVKIILLVAGVLAVSVIGFLLLRGNNSSERDIIDEATRKITAGQDSSIVEQNKNKEDTNDLCDNTLEESKLSQLAGVSLMLQFGSDASTQPYTCIYVNDQLSMTIMVVTGSKADEEYQLNKESVNTELDSRFEGVGTESHGFIFEETLNINAYKAGRAWVSVSMQGELDTDKKVAGAKAIAEYVLAKL